eukprot:GFKZ01002365.1.p1 GENE.GFKZ01002365.1~~GFKZ01002365.1.p1  ORF type:complete len:655 (-),score=70.27 GFKZ01002365.1:1441-3405(-)
MSADGQSGSPPSLGVLFLAAGYGTRLASDISRTPALSHLSTTPKPLLPLSGLPILSHWLHQLPPAHLVVVCNDLHLPLYLTWAATLPPHPHPTVRVISDGTNSNSTRLGAVADISLGLQELQSLRVDVALVIAGDTLLPQLHFASVVEQFLHERYELATFAYRLRDMADCVRRGMFRVDTKDGILIATEVVEKPRTVDLAPSDLACAPIYMLRKSVWGSVDRFLEERRADALEIKDAPGFWLRWIVKRYECRLFQVRGRIDIGGLGQYYDALCALASHERAQGEPSVGRAYPRVGLLGNPSDGYGGKVVAIAIASEGFAQVVATESERFIVNWNMDHELPESFGSLGQFVNCVEKRGVFYGARALVLAAALVFAREMRLFVERRSGKCEGKGLDGLPNCQLTYSTTIPVRIGLSGSSALILATFRALARFYGTSLEEVNEDIRVWPSLMRSAEAEVLGIACGLQDRIVQLMQGCVAMDFTEEGKGREWERLSEDALPELWIAYAEAGTVGESSGTVHGSLRKRFLARDSELLSIIEELKQVADSGRELLLSYAQGHRDSLNDFPKLVTRNFELRRALVGEAGIGNENLALVSTAREAGFAAKLTGSGGCVLCVPEPIRELSKGEVENAVTIFKKNGMVLRKVEVLRRRDWENSS